MHLEVEIMEEQSFKALPVREGYIENKIILLSTGVMVMDNHSKTVSGEILYAVAKGLLKARERAVIRAALDEYKEKSPRRLRVKGL